MNEGRLFRILLLANVISFVMIPIVLYFLYEIRSILTPTLSALLVAYLLYPVVKWTARIGIPRPVTALTLVACLLGSIVLVVFSLLPAIRNQVRFFSQPVAAPHAAPPDTVPPTAPPPPATDSLGLDKFDDAPPTVAVEHATETRIQQMFNRGLDNLRRWGIVSASRSNLVDQIAAYAAQLGLEMLRHVTSLAVEWGRFSMIFLFVLIFALLDGDRLPRAALQFVPNEFFEPALFILHKTQTILGYYLRGLFVETIIMAIGTFALLLPLCVFSDLRVTMALVVALIIALTNPIRIIGPIVGGGIGVLVALTVTSNWVVLIGITAVVVVIQILDGIIILPMVMRDQVNVHPVLCLLGVVVGGILAGPLGMMLAIPVIGGIKVVYRVVAVEMKRFVEPGGIHDYTAEHLSEMRSRQAAHYRSTR